MARPSTGRAPFKKETRSSWSLTRTITLKELPAGDPSLVEELYQDEHVIIVNKPEGMKTHANEPTEIALLNHVSSYVGSTCYVVHRLDKETSGAILFAKILLSCPFSTVFWKIKHPTRVLGLDPRQLSTKPSSTRIKSDAIAMRSAQAPGRSTQGAVLRNSGDATEKSDETAWSNASSKRGVPIRSGCISPIMGTRLSGTLSITLHAESDSCSMLTAWPSPIH